MEPNNNMQQTNPAPMPQAAPAAPQQMAAPQAVDQSAAVNSATQPSTGAGGPFDFLRGINWLETGFMVIAAWGIYETIYYYRRKGREEKTAYYDVQRRSDKLDQRQSATEAEIYNIYQMLQPAG